MNVLFLCTGNTVRSVMAEAIANAHATMGIRAFSAGTNPAGRLHPEMLRLLSQRGLSTQGLRSKNWREFSSPGAPSLDLLVTLCPVADAERTADRPSATREVYWDIPDPVSAPPDQQQLALQVVFDKLSRRIDALQRDETVDGNACAGVCTAGNPHPIGTGERS